MSGEERERFEDYLELEHYIEQLQAGRVAHPPAELNPSQASVYRMAALFRSATPEASEPRPEFAAELKARLEQELHLPQEEAAPSPPPRKQQQKFRGVSRRALLTSGAAVAASLVVGAGVGAAAERIVEQPKTSQPPVPAPYSEKLVGTGVATVWHLVTPLALLGKGAVPFKTDAIVGYVIRNDGDNGEPAVEKEPVVALSAACTHMGCIVKWQDSDRKFHCPCHGGLFTEYGKVDNRAWGVRYLYALPRLNTKIENGNVYVEVPATKS